MDGRLRQLLFGRFAKSAAAMQLGMVVSAACALGASIVLVRGLGQTGYGRYALVFALYGLVNILGDVGLGKASIARLAEARGGRDGKALVGEVAYVLKLTVVTGMLVTAVGLASAPLLARALGRTLDVGPAARVLFVAGVAGIGHAFVATLLAGLRRLKALAALESAFAVVRVIAIAVVVVAGGGLWGVVAVHVGVTLAVSVAGLLAYELIVAGAEGLPPLWTLARTAVRAPWWERFRFSTRVAIDRQALKLIEVLPVLVLGRIAASPEPAGYFSLGRNIVRNLGVLFLAVSKSLLPFFAELKGKQQYRRLRRDYYRATVAGGLGALGVAVLCVPLLPIALRFLYGAPWDEAVTGVAAVLLARFVMDGLCVGLGSLLIVADATLWSARLKVASVPVGVGALLGGAFLGKAALADAATGTAIGVAAAYTLWWLVLQTVQLAASSRLLARIGAETPVVGPED